MQTSACLNSFNKLSAFATISLCLYSGAFRMCPLMCVNRCVVRDLSVCQLQVLFILLYSAADFSRLFYVFIDKFRQVGIHSTSYLHPLLSHYVSTTVQIFQQIHKRIFFFENYHSNNLSGNAVNVGAGLIFIVELPRPTLLFPIRLLTKDGGSLFSFFGKSE